MDAGQAECKIHTCQADKTKFTKIIARNLEKISTSSQQEDEKISTPSQQEDETRTDQGYMEWEKVEREMPVSRDGQANQAAQKANKSARRPANYQGAQ